MRCCDLAVPKKHKQSPLRSRSSTYTDHGGVQSCESLTGGKWCARCHEWQVIRVIVDACGNRPRLLLVFADCRARIESMPLVWLSTVRVVRAETRSPWLFVSAVGKNAVYNDFCERGEEISSIFCRGWIYSGIYFMVTWCMYLQRAAVLALQALY